MGVTRFTPLEWQIAPWKSRKPIILLTGTAGGGKSRVAGEKIHAFLMKYPGATGLVLRKTRESLKNSVIAFMKNRVIGSDPRIRYKPSEYRFEYPNGSMLVWGGMKDAAQREAIRSIGQDGSLDIVWIEEANSLSEEDFNEIIPRMRGQAANWRQVILTTNPDSPYHWIYQRLIRGEQAEVFYSRYDWNTYNPDDYHETLKNLTGVQFLRLVEGRWVQAEGLIWDSWDWNVNTCDPFEIPSDWRRYRTIDFGYTNPFVCQWWALDHDDRAFMYREIYHTEILVPDAARRIQELSQGEKIIDTIADHDPGDRGLLNTYGIPTVPAKKDVSSGLQAVHQRIRKAGDGKPRLTIMRGALDKEDPRLKDKYLPTCTEQEVVGYVWDKTKRVKEEPMKINDHGCDAMRYFIVHVDPMNAVDIMSLSGIYEKEKIGLFGIRSA